MIEPHKSNTMLRKKSCVKSVIVGLLIGVLTVFLVQNKGYFKGYSYAKTLNYPVLQDTETRICSKGPAPFTLDWLHTEFAQFARVYDKRPAENRYGTKFAHQFAMWATIRHFQPKHIIESGIFKGLGTWMLRQAAPHAQLILLDPKAEHLEYTDTHPDTKYFIQKDFIDFNQIDFDKLFIDKTQTLIYFDDHQNSIKRVQQAYKKGFRIVMFDDNNEEGTYSNPLDSTSLRQAISLVLGTNTTEVTHLIDNFGQIREPLTQQHIKVFNETLNRMVEQYYELPFPYQAPKTVYTGPIMFPEFNWYQLKDEFHMVHPDFERAHSEFNHVCLVILKAH